MYIGFSGKIKYVDCLKFYFFEFSVLFFNANYIKKWLNLANFYLLDISLFLLQSLLAISTTFTIQTNGSVMSSQPKVSAFTNFVVFKSTDGQLKIFCSQKIDSEKAAMAWLNSQDALRGSTLVCWVPYSETNDFAHAFHLIFFSGRLGDPFTVEFTNLLTQLIRKFQAENSISWAESFTGLNLEDLLKIVLEPSSLEEDSIINYRRATVELIKLDSHFYTAFIYILIKLQNVMSHL